MNTQHPDKNAGEELKEFKQNVKEWMKQHRIKASDFAEWLNKSVGTIKNWLYTPLNITEENQKLILHYIDQYEKGCISISGEVNISNPWQNIGFIHIDTNKLSSYEQEYWCMAAEVSTNFLNSEPTVFSDPAEYIKFAEWFTSKMMESTGSVIGSVYKKLQKNNQRFNLSDYLTGYPYIPSHMEPIKIEDINTYLPDNPTIREYELCSIFLPVNKKEWKSAYLVVAAKINEMTPTDFVLSVLRKEAKTMEDCSLQDFLNMQGQSLSPAP